MYAEFVVDRCAASLQLSVRLTTVGSVPIMLKSMEQYSYEYNWVALLKISTKQEAA